MNCQSLYYSSKTLNKFTTITDFTKKVRIEKKFINQSGQIIMKQELNRLLQDLKKEPSNDKKWQMLIKWLELFSKSI